MTQIRNALDSAAPGTAIVYHTGTSLKGAANLSIIRRLYDAGRVDLVQKRVDEGFAYAYIAQFRRVPARVLETFASAGLLS